MRALPHIDRARQNPAADVPATRPGVCAASRPVGGRWTERLCQSCHTQADCTGCHDTTQGLEHRAAKTRSRGAHAAARGADFDARHALEAQAEPARCVRCHEPQTCESCHRERGVSGNQIGAQQSASAGLGRKIQHRLQQLSWARGAPRHLAVRWLPRSGPRHQLHSLPQGRRVWRQSASQRLAEHAKSPRQHVSVLAMVEPRLTRRLAAVSARALGLVTLVGAAALALGPSCLERRADRADEADAARCATCHGDPTRKGDYLRRAAPPRDLLACHGRRVSRSGRACHSSQRQQRRTWLAQVQRVPYRAHAQ